MHSEGRCKLLLIAKVAVPASLSLAGSFISVPLLHPNCIVFVFFLLGHCLLPLRFVTLDLLSELLLWLLCLSSLRNLLVVLDLSCMPTERYHHLLFRRLKLLPSNALLLVKLLHLGD